LKIVSRFDEKSDVILFNGEALDLLKKVPDSFVQLVVASPPYNIGKSYEIQTSLSDYLDSMLPVIKEINRVLNDTGSVCWQVGNYVNSGEKFPLDIFFYPLFKNEGMRLRNRIIWHFEHGLHASKRLSDRYETILWFTKSDNYTFNLDPIRVPAKYPGKTIFKKDSPNYGKPSGNPLGKNPSDVWEVLLQDWEKEIWNIPNVKANHPEKTDHPCQFPIELVQRCILALTNEFDWVLDPFGGVGSSVLAAVLLNRRGMLSDREGRYIDIAKQRVRDLINGDLKIRPINKKICKPSGKVSKIPEEWL